jgi:hypothetical protein
LRLPLLGSVLHLGLPLLLGRARLSLLSRLLRPALLRRALGLLLARPRRRLRLLQVLGRLA